MTAQQKPPVSAGTDNDPGGDFSKRDTGEHTTTPTETETLINLACKIEQDRRATALKLAETYERSPEAAIGCRLVLRDLRLLGLEIGRLAFSQTREGK